MSRDPLDERAQQLFASARQESPSEETRGRIAAALRAEPPSGRTFKDFKVARLSRSRLWVPLVLAAAVFGALALALRNTEPNPFDISAEHLGGDVARRSGSEPLVEHAPSEKAVAAPHPSKAEKQRATLPVSPPKAAKASRPSLEEELAGMQRARTLLDRGDGALALSELNSFDRGLGFRRLSVEASLLRIEALAQSGKTEEARVEARRFVEKNPDDPLVDRAEKFAHPPARPDTRDFLKSEPVQVESD